MTHHRRIDPTRAAGALHVEHCDIPAGMTLGEWRRQCGLERRAADAVAATAAAQARSARTRAVGTSLRRALRLG